MDLRAAIADDCEIFDATQTVTLTLVGGTSVSVTNVTTTKLNYAQTQQYGLAGLDNEMLNFSLPVSKLGGNVPTQDATITDSDGAQWNIKSVELRTVRTRYFCMCQRLRNEITLPYQPSDLDLTVQSPSQILLEWSDENDGTATYEIQTSPNGSTGWTAVATTAAGAESYRHQMLEPETTYHYRIRAVRDGLQSDWVSLGSGETDELLPTYVYNINSDSPPAATYLCAVGGLAAATAFEIADLDLSMQDRSAWRNAIAVGSLLQILAADPQTPKVLYRIDSNTPLTGYGSLAVTNVSGTDFAATVSFIGVYAVP